MSRALEPHSPGAPVRHGRLRWWLVGAALIAAGLLWRRGRAKRPAPPRHVPADSAGEEPLVPRDAPDLAPAAEPDLAPAAPDIQQEEDRVRTSPTVWWIAGSVLLVLLGVGWPWGMMAVRGEAPQVHVGRGYGTAVPEFAGGLHEAPFRSAVAAARQRSAAPSDLDRFEWVDARARIVRIPVADAMDLWLARAERGAGSGQ